MNQPRCRDDEEEGVVVPQPHLPFTSLLFSLSTVLTVASAGSRSLAKKHRTRGTHQTGSWAANSPVTDGEHVYAYFGSRGLYCYDMQGNLQWEKDLGDMATKMSFGEGSSPVLYGDVIILNWDHEGDSFIITLDKRTGERTLESGSR